jgi:hypothetical protein
MRRSIGRYAASMGFAVLVAASAQAQEDLGGQRVATSMLTFLKIGVGARAVAMGEAFTPVADDATALHWNPAGLTELVGRRVHLSHVEWPADIDYDNVMFTAPVEVLGGAAGIQVASLRTTLDYTSTEEPLPHGRTFSYSDFLLGIGFARQFTDRFTLGGGVKYLREDLGSEVGGSTVNSWSLDLGTVFRLPYRGFRVSMAWTNFGPDFQPSGGFVSNPPLGPSSVVAYDSFSPASIFAFGAAMEPLTGSHYRLLVTVQFDHPADGEELIKGGGELWIDEMVALRAGWNPRADAMRFSTGLGLRGKLGGRWLELDYAYTDGNDLGRIDRFSLEVSF